MEIFHASFTQRTSQKREITEVLSSCSYGTLVLSLCQNPPTPQTWRKVCVADPFADLRAYHQEHGSCNPNEICFNGVWEASGYRFPAYCLRTTSFSPIKTKTDWQIAENDFLASMESVGQNFAVQAILTGPDGTSSLTARQLTIEAQANHPMYGVDSWNAIPGGRNSCALCTGVDLQPVPSGTGRIQINALLNSHNNVGGRLYVAGSSG